jgi:HEAT repeat protein
MWQRTAIAALVSLATVCAVAQEASQPATLPTPSDHERLGDLIALIEGQNTPEGRRTIARELLLQRWPEATARLASLLSGTNGPAKIALASTLADLPQFLDPAYVEPLLGMMKDADAAVRQAAASALAAYPNNGVRGRLRELAGDREQPRLARLAAISALGQMTDREAIEALVANLGDPDPVVAQTALAAMSQATAMDFNDDIQAARAWWDESSALPREAWQQLQIDRLVRKDRETRRRLETVEARLSKLLEAGFLRAPDNERLALLTSYLTDATSAIRLLGLHLAQMHLAEGRSLPPELQDRIRDLLSSAEPREQAAAVQTVAALREPRDAERFLDLLRTVHNREVRLALFNGLGYIGNGAATEVLLRALEDPDEACAVEAVAGLGRLAERGVLETDARERVAAALLQAFEKMQPAAARERVLWAMGNVADVRFGPALVAALDRRESVPVRLAAVRGIARLKNPQLADALADAAGDPDASVRKAAIETLATIGSSASDKQVQALWERVLAPAETDEAIRQAAWRSLLEVLSRGSSEDLERCIARLPGSTSQDTQRRIELLERLAKLVHDAEPVDRGRLGLVRARLAAQYVRLEQPAEAVAAYVAALTDLEAAKSDALHRVALELLRYALLNGWYDEAVAGALAAAFPANERQTLWQAAKTEIDSRLTPAAVDQAVAMLTATRGGRRAQPTPGPRAAAQAPRNADRPGGLRSGHVRPHFASSVASLARRLGRRRQARRRASAQQIASATSRRRPGLWGRRKFFSHNLQLSLDSLRACFIYVGEVTDDVVSSENERVVRT